MERIQEVLNNVLSPRTLTLLKRYLMRNSTACLHQCRISTAKTFVSWRKKKLKTLFEDTKTSCNGKLQNDELLNTDEHQILTL